METKTRLLSGIGNALLACAMIVFQCGCEDSTPEEADVPGADPQAPFAITEPPSGGSVSASGVIKIKGVGLRDVSSVNAEVLTNKWYAQPGALHVSQNNSWSYEPIVLGGQGGFNNHTIRVKVIHSDGSREIASVTGIVRLR